MASNTTVLTKYSSKLTYFKLTYFEVLYIKLDLLSQQTYYMESISNTLQANKGGYISTNLTTMQPIMHMKANHKGEGILNPKLS